MRRSALSVAIVMALAVSLSGCSREKIDWKSAEAADTVESYDHFIERHPDSALVTQARVRVAQLNEDRDWKKATAADTADAYRQFLAQHESGKWSEEARIRVENFALDGTPTGPGKPTDAVPTPAAAAPATAASAVPAAPVTAHGPKEAQTPSRAPTAASPPTAAPAKSAVPATKGAVMATDTKVSSAPKPVTTKSAAAKPTEKPVAVAMTPAPVSKPAAGSAAPASSPGQFGIQLGAFHSQDAALKNWKQLQVAYDSDLHGLFAHAVPVKQGSGQLFRLQAPVGEESRARGICASLAKHSQPCVVVLPQPQASP